jgi:hypothetical protein
MPQCNQDTNAALAFIVKDCSPPFCLLPHPAVLPLITKYTPKPVRASPLSAPAAGLIRHPAGDGGTSTLFNGERRSKRDAYFCALGSIDELNSHLGLARDFLSAAARDSKQQQPALEEVQLHLYQVSHPQCFSLDLSCQCSQLAISLGV